MTFEELVKANESIKTTDIKGKDYAEVNQRVKAFRMLYPNGSIETELVSIADGVCVIRAIIKDEEGKVIANGTAYEKENSTFINKTSYIENCETSAVGRALGMVGIGIDVSIASFEEVTNAINNQDKPKKSAEIKEINKKMEDAKADAKKPVNEAKNDVEVADIKNFQEELDVRVKVMKYINDHVTDPEKIKKLCMSYKVNSINEMNKQQCEHYLAILKKNNINI